MRSTVLACGVAVAAPGCNWVFGVNKTSLQDATDAPSGPPPHASLTWMNLVSIPLDELAFPPVSGVSVQVGPLDGPLVAVQVDPATGGFDMPYRLTEAPYRIVYMLPNDPVPHEVQWQVPTGAHLTVPLFGQVARASTPPGSGYKIELNYDTTTDPWPCGPTPPNPPCFSQRTGMAAYTTGTWMGGGGSYKHTGGNQQEVDLLGFAALDGAPGVSPSSDTDLLAILHYDSNQTADAYVVVAAQALVNGSLTDEGGQTFKQFGTSAQGIKFQANPFGPNTSIIQAMGGTYDSATAISGVETTAGVIPSYSMPSITLPSNDGDFDQSVLVPLSTATSSTFGSCRAYSTFVDPFTPSDVPPEQFRPVVVRYRQFISRRIGAATSPLLATGFQAISSKTQYSKAECPNGLAFAAPFAFTTPLANAVTFSKPLSSDRTPVTLRSHGFQDLTFALGELGDTTDCVVTLYGYDGASALTRLSTFLVLAQPSVSVHVPTDQFVTGQTYAFGIVCRNTYSSAPSGDYTFFRGYPQQESQIFPGTFVVTLQ